MKLKIKFFALISLLLFARGCDFYSTSLWFFQPDGMQGETNPLTRYFGVGWKGLIIANVIVVGFVIAAYYFYVFKYKPKKLPAKPGRFIDCLSQLYYGEKGVFYRVFYALPTDKRMMVAHMGYVLLRVIIVGSFLATIHNLCQFYDVQFYNTFREIVRRPLYVIYGLIFGSFIYYQYQVLKQEYAYP